MDTLSDVVDRERRSDQPALRVDPIDRELSYHDVITTAHKAANFLHYLGTRADHRVVVAPEQRPQPVLSFFGAALIGAVTDVTPPAEANEPGRVVVVSDDGYDDLDLERPDYTTVVVYGDDPEESGVHHWETDVWSENPESPAAAIDPDTPALAALGRDHDHGALLSGAQRVVDATNLQEDDTVAVRGPLSDSRTITAGIIAPLMAGATIVFPDEETEADIAIGEDGPEPRRVELFEVTMA